MDGKVEEAFDCKIPLYPGKKTSSNVAENLARYDAIGSWADLTLSLD